MKFGSRSFSLLTKIAYGKLLSVVIFEVKAFHSNLSCFLAILLAGSVQLQHSSGGFRKPEVPEEHF